jgi:hypothetical protein
VAGSLTIHSEGSGELLSGHSWIEYSKDGGATHTYGTWGNDPLGTGNGLFEDLERGRTSDVSRTVTLTDDQEKQLFDEIEKARSKGQNGWGYLNPCSSFAAETWNKVTGEDLGHRSGLISNPSKLKSAIHEANNKGAPMPGVFAPTPSSRPASSRRLISSAVEPCGSRADSSVRSP